MPYEGFYCHVCRDEQAKAKCLALFRAQSEMIEEMRQALERVTRAADTAEARAIAAAALA
jgi:hypothetical protein